jgi:hypothetical protein
MKTTPVVCISLTAMRLWAVTSAARAPAGALVETVRPATKRFQTVEEATAAGSADALVCVSGPEAGAMGVHCGNATLIGDGELDPERPELLVYEPKNGQLHRVAVEYLVIAADGTPSTRRHRCSGNCFMTMAARIAMASQRVTSCTSGPGSIIHTGCAPLGIPQWRARDTRQKPRRQPRQRRTGPVTDVIKRVGRGHGRGHCLRRREWESDRRRQWPPPPVSRLELSHN